MHNAPHYQSSAQSLDQLTVAIRQATCSPTNTREAADGHRGQGQQHETRQDLFDVSPTIRRDHVIPDLFSNRKTIVRLAHDLQTLTRQHRQWG